MCVYICVCVCVCVGEGVMPDKRSIKIMSNITLKTLRFEKNFINNSFYSYKYICVTVCACLCVCVCGWCLIVCVCTYISYIALSS